MGCQSSHQFTLQHTQITQTKVLFDSIRQNADDYEANKTIGELESELALIEAIEERNKAQIFSFIDEEDQWNSMEQSERELLQNKNNIISRLQEFKSDQ